MPNWVRNVVKMKGIGKLPIYSIGDDGNRFFDFDTLIPMPMSLNVESGSIETLAIQCAQAKLMRDGRKKFNNVWAGLAIPTEERLERMSESRHMTVSELEQTGLQYIWNIIRYDASTWYDWRVKNWGTKWNSSPVSFSDDIIVFDTAWSEPEPVLRELAMRYPDVSIEHWWADEDMEGNAGYTEWAEDGAVYTHRADCDQERYELYIKCWGESDCLYEDENGKIVRRDCENCPGC